MGGGAQPHPVPWPSQPERRLLGAASGRQTRPRALGQALERPGRGHGPCHRPPSSALMGREDTSSKSNERLEIARFLIRKPNHSFRGLMREYLITATLPPSGTHYLPKRSNRPAACHFI
eukprot:2655964-Prymnesium_polylepis.2